MAKEGLFYRFLLWRDKHIKEKHFILVISFLVGICTAASAIILKQLIHLIQHILTGNFDASGVNYLYLLYPVIGDWVFELSVGYLMQLVVAVTVFCALFRRMMEQVGFPPREYWLKYATWLVLYIVTLYGTGWFFTQIAGKIVLLRLPILSYSIFCLLLGAGLYAIHFWRYGKDPRLSARI